MHLVNRSPSQQTFVHKNYRTMSVVSDGKSQQPASKAADWLASGYAS